jgi:fructose-bisphosphate aldolase, class II
VEAARVILKAGPGTRAHTPLPVLAAMFGSLADAASVPVVLHLDHATDQDEIARAIALGFTSVMFDGSRLPLDDNIAATRAVVALARPAGVSVEAELGFVGYAGGAASRGTDPDEAAVFWRQTGVDALAVSVGNEHLMTAAGAVIDRGRLDAIAAACPGLPLVLHGGSGIAPAERARLARESQVAKFNIGTELRQTFGAALRRTLADDPALFDRIAILKGVEVPLCDAARAAIRSCRGA